MPASIASTIGAGPPFTAATSPRDRSSTASASTHTHYYPQSAAREPHADFLPDLAGLDAPALVIKGSCDYLSWSSAQEYLRVLPDARLSYLDGAGHNAYQDEPERYMEEVRAFLLGRRPLEAPYEGNRPPDDYEGPH